MTQHNPRKNSRNTRMLPHASRTFNSCGSVEENSDVGRVCATKQNSFGAATSLIWKLKGFI